MGGGRVCVESCWKGGSAMISFPDTVPGVHGLQEISSMSDGPSSEPGRSLNYHSLLPFFWGLVDYD